MRRIALLMTLLGACASTAGLDGPPADLGDFVLGHNITVTDKMQMVPISRAASGAEWEAAMERAVADRFGRYDGSRIYNIGIAIDGYALAPPGIPVVAAPKSVLVITANIWDDARQAKLNAEGKQLTVFENLDGENLIGTGLTRTREEQMAALAYNAAGAVESWLLEHPEWFADPAEAASLPQTGALAKTTTAVGATAQPGASIGAK
ncbi:MAG: hypothetical protein WAK98_04515 [Gemmobacter sp.]